MTASTGHVLQFLKHWRTPHEDAGCLMRIFLAWFQYQAGVSYPILQHTGQDLSYAQGRFVPAVRRYLQNFDSIIEVDKPYIYPKLRDNDITIMDIAATTELTPIQMKRLNQVRIHLGVMWVSEISHIDETQIRNDIIIHQVDKMAYTPTLTKLYQPRPNSNAS